MSAELGILAGAMKYSWLLFVGIFGWVLKKRDAKIDQLEDQMKNTISKPEAKELIKDAIQPVRDEMSRFQQSMTETNLLVRQISDNLTKLHTEFTVNIRVQEALAKQHKEES